MSPESLSGTDILSMSEQQPETKDWLGEDIENSISDDLSIDTPLSGSISNTPDNWVQSPEDESEASNGSEELSSGVGLGSDSTTTWNDELVYDDQVRSTSHGVPSPLLTFSVSECSEKTGEDHDQICNNGDCDIGSVHASEESKIEEEKGGGESPVDITSPEDLTEDMFDSVGGVLVDLLDNDVGKRVAVAGGHGEVGESGKCSDEGGDDMEEAFLLYCVRFCVAD